MSHGSSFLDSDGLSYLDGVVALSDLAFCATIGALPQWLRLSHEISWGTGRVYWVYGGWREKAGELRGTNSVGLSLFSLWFVSGLKYGSKWFKVPNFFSYRRAPRMSITVESEKRRYRADVEVKRARLCNGPGL